MFEKKLKKISRKIGENELRKYYILTHKKHQREFYFQNSKKAREFLKEKINIPSNRFRKTKKLAYFLIKLGLLQPFLKKIDLSSEFGDIIFVAEQIKGFNFKNKRVVSFPLHKKNKNFIRSKKFQKKVAEKGFAPEIFEINEKIPYSKEQLLRVFQDGSHYKIFKKLR